MSALDSFQFPPPVDWPAFERLCRDLYCKVWNDPHAQQNGRNGQRQNGVDIFGISSHSGGYEGVQCKGRDGRYGEVLTEKELRSAVNEAKGFEPPLKKLILATSAKRDESLQRVAREITYENQAAGLFDVVVESWVDILARLNYYEDIARLHLRPIFPPGAPVAPQPPESSRSREFFSIEEMKLSRTYVMKGPVGNARPLLLIAASIGAVSTLAMLSMPILYFKGILKNFPTGTMGLPIIMAISFYFALRANALLRCRFTDTVPPFRKLFFEANKKGDIFITKLAATCPHCGSTMRLQVVGDWRYETEEQFVCYTNPEQHRIRLDHTVLPEP